MTDPHESKTRELCAYSPFKCGPLAAALVVLGDEEKAAWLLAEALRETATEARSRAFDECARIVEGHLWPGAELERGLELQNVAWSTVAAAIRAAKEKLP